MFNNHVINYVISHLVRMRGHVYSHMFSHVFNHRVRMRGHVFSHVFNHLMHMRGHVFSHVFRHLVRMRGHAFRHLVRMRGHVFRHLVSMCDPERTICLLLSPIHFSCKLHYLNHVGKIVTEVPRQTKEALTSLFLMVSNALGLRVLPYRNGCTAMGQSLL